MRIAVAGVTSEAGRLVVPALTRAGHQVVGLPDSPALLDPSCVAAVMRGCDALVNVAGQVPVGDSARRRRAWRRHGLLRSAGARCLLDAAAAAGVRRVVHHSTSLLYADHGDDWITERSLLWVTPLTEPISVAEATVQQYAGCSRVAVVLRMAAVVGRSSVTDWSLRTAARGRPIGLGTPDGYTHVMHSDDVGPAVLAALTAPSGTYNVGAEPVRRGEVVAAHAAAVGRGDGQFLPQRQQRGCGGRLEPLARSLRVSSAQFTQTTGWFPRHEAFDASWVQHAALQAARP